MGRAWSRKEPVENLSDDAPKVGDVDRSELPEIPEFERKRARAAASISWWIGPGPVGFTSVCYGQVERMRPRAHMVPDSKLSYYCCRQERRVKCR